MLIEQGVIAGDGERWQVRLDRLETIHIPATLTGVLQARLDSLSVAERETLQRASVVGRLFWDAAVAYVAGTEPTAVEPLLPVLGVAGIGGS
jgi:predicted ATPase